MSTAPKDNDASRVLRRAWVPALVLITSLGLTAFATYYAARSVRLQARQQFNAEAHRALSAVQTRMESYLALLRGGAAFYDASDQVSRTQFARYVERLRLQVYYPGIQGFGFSARLLPEKVDEVIAEARTSGLTNFHIWPIIPGQDIHAILFLEPMDRRNTAALGYNMFSEPIRQAAMTRARDSGSAVATGAVTLVQEIEGPVQQGFLIYTPVYETGTVPSNEAERRSKLRGFIYAPFRAEDLFKNIFPAHEMKELEIVIYDGPAADPKRLLYKRPAPSGANAPVDAAYSATASLELAQRNWTIAFAWRAPGPGSHLVPLVFAIGIILSLLLFTLSFLEARARAKLEMANERLTLSEQSLREARGRLEEHARELEQRVADRTARLQETVRDLEAVLYHVAHDLRAPVRAMGSFASILRDDYGGRLDDRAVGYLKRISEAASRMDRLVYDLLAYGRLAQMPMDLETVSLEKTLTTLLSRANDELRSRSAEVRVTGEMPEVCANPGVLADIIHRLLDNALKFVPEDRKPRIHIHAEKGARVRLIIEDNGIGIRPEYHDRIFRVFERLHPSHAYPGTGIGLAIARKALERMGGYIGVESTPGQGSRFWMELERPGENPQGRKSPLKAKE